MGEMPGKREAMRFMAARIVVAMLIVCFAAACGSNSVETIITTAAPTTTAVAATSTTEGATAAPTTTEASPTRALVFHNVSADAVMVSGTGTCSFGEGTGADGGEGYVITCELDMSDPRVSGTETQDRFRTLDGGDFGNVWVAEEDVITNADGTWHGSAQIVHDDTAPAGEAHFLGEGAYAGLEFHYYFSGYCGDPNQIELRGWISPVTTASDSATTEGAPFHSVPDSPVAVSGKAACEYSDQGVNPDGGDGLFFECDFDMSDPRVSGVETQDRFRRYCEGQTGDVWVAEEDIITNADGSWRGIAQMADDGIPSGEAHFTGEGAYEGLEFHYYFSGACGSVREIELRGWISNSA